VYISITHASMYTSIILGSLNEADRFTQPLTNRNLRTRHKNSSVGYHKDAPSLALFHARSSIPPRSEFAAALLIRKPEREREERNELGLRDDQSVPTKINSTIVTSRDTRIQDGKERERERDAGRRS